MQLHLEDEDRRDHNLRVAGLILIVGRGSLDNFLVISSWLKISVFLLPLRFRDSPEPTNKYLGRKYNYILLQVQ